MTEECRVIIKEQWEDYLKLKEQLKEANNIIVRADWDCNYELQMKCGFSDYLKKYDVRGGVYDLG